MDNIRFVSIDPGVNLGISCLEVEVATKRTIVLDSHTLRLNDVANAHYAELVEAQGLPLARIIIIEDALKKYLAHWTPNYVIHETAFSAHGRRFGGSIESFASLRENILGIKLAACRYDNTLPIIPINPSTVKYVVAGEKSDDKEMIKKALIDKVDLDLSNVSLEFADQHELDSIAIGYTFVHKHIFGVSENERAKRSKNAKRHKTKTIR